MFSTLVQSECNSLWEMSELFYHWLWFDSQETCGLSQTCIYHGLSSLTPQGTERTQERLQSVSAAPRSLSAALTSAPIKRMLCVCVRLFFSQSVNSSGFSRRSPHWSFFWPSKITFFGLIIRYPLPVQITALCWDGPRTATETARWANVHDASTVTKRIKAS